MFLTMSRVALRYLLCDHALIDNQRRVARLVDPRHRMVFLLEPRRFDHFADIRHEDQLMLDDILSTATNCLSSHAQMAPGSEVSLLRE